LGCWVNGFGGIGGIGIGVVVGIRNAALFVCTGSESVRCITDDMVY